MTQQFAQVGGGAIYNAVGATTTVPLTPSLALQPTYFGIAAVTIKSTTATVTGVAQPDSPNLGWRSLGRVVGSVVTVEVLLLWGFSAGAMGAVTVTYSATNYAEAAMGFFETGAVQTSAIAASALTGASGTGTAADPGGSVTGSVGDLVVTVAGWNSTTGYASVTDTVPNTGDTMQSGTVNGTHAWGGIGTYLIWKVVRTAGAHRRVMTWGASVSWAAAVFTVTPVPPSATPATSGLFKGRTTKTADLGAVA